MNSCRFDQLTYFYQHVSLAYSIEASCLLFLQVYAPLLAAFTTQAKSEINLLVKVQVNLKIHCFFLVQFFHSLICVYLFFLLQEYCYDNMSFMKVFQKMVMLFYKSKKRGKTVLLFWGIFFETRQFHSTCATTIWQHNLCRTYKNLCQLITHIVTCSFSHRLQTRVVHADR